MLPRLLAIGCGRVRSQGRFKGVLAGARRSFFAGVAQLVELQPSKLVVASSNLVSRSVGQLAQLVERRPEEAGVGSSSLSLATDVSVAQW